MKPLPDVSAHTLVSAAHRSGKTLTVHAMMEAWFGPPRRLTKREKKALKRQRARNRGAR